MLLLERGLEPELCSELLAYFAANEAQSSGFMVEEDGQTVLKQDTARKRRRDCTIEDNTLREKVRMRIVRRIVPEFRYAEEQSTPTLAEVISIKPPLPAV